MISVDRSSIGGENIKEVVDEEDSETEYSMTTTRKTSFNVILPASMPPKKIKIKWIKRKPLKRIAKMSKISRRKKKNNRALSRIIKECTKFSDYAYKPRSLQNT